MEEIVIEFLLLQIQLIQLKRIKSFYRGDDLDNVYKRFDVINDNTEYNKRELLKRIFLIGDKSRFFYDDQLFEINNFSREIELTDESEKVLEKIFLTFFSATKSKRAYLKGYFANNEILNEYFSNKSNKIKFINSIKNSDNAFFYRNYYLKILHQLYYIRYRNNSHFVSTSLNKEVSQKFTSENGIIIHCWQPNIWFLKKKFEKHHLPKQKYEAFTDQKELSFLAGILPHYISAVELTKEKKVYFNPSILENEINRKTFDNGLEIDQSDFEEVIVKTRFRKYFSQKGQGYDEHNFSR